MNNRRKSYILSLALAAGLLSVAPNSSLHGMSFFRSESSQNERDVLREILQLHLEKTNEIRPG